jgi:hypothetical protein
LQKHEIEALIGGRQDFTFHGGGEELVSHAAVTIQGRRGEEEIGRRVAFVFFVVGGGGGGGGYELYEYRQPR